MNAHWIALRREALRLVIARMGQNLFATLLTLGVLGATLALPCLLYTLVDNLARETGALRNTPQVSLFLRLDINDGERTALQQRIAAHLDVRTSRYIPRETAWQQMREDAGLAEVTADLERNPLPDAFVLTARQESPEAMEALRAETAQWPGVERAQMDGVWIKRLHALVRLGHTAVATLAALLGFAVLAIIGNTVRLQVLTQREEIEVSTLMGATDSFIRRPFLYTGAIHGLLGGLLAWLILWGALQAFNFSVRELSALYGLEFQLQLAGPAAFATLLISATLLGWISAYWAANRALHAIEPA